MEKELFIQIREKKKVWEDEEVKDVIPFISSMYSSKTQLLFEILQNADDACTRLKTTGINKDYFIVFNLFPDKLWVIHNGIPFDDDDINSICSVLKSPKADDPTLIGKFGIGFKSVYQYTSTPRIYSNNEISGESNNFIIRKYVLPFEIPGIDIINEDETLIEIPFNKPNKKPETSFAELSEALRKFEKRNILFLNTITELSWKNQSDGGRYLKKSSLKDESKWVTLAERKKIDENENWLIYDKIIKDNGNERKVEIAYLLNENDSKKRIIPIKNAKLYSYFQTDKDTYLRFLIQGPFLTTPSRDNIQETDWNDSLIEDISSLVSESIGLVKKSELLDISFLQTLPINTESFEEGDTFYPIFQSVREVLGSTKELLPKRNGGFIQAKNSLLGVGRDFRNLLNSRTLSEVYSQDNIEWLDENITPERTPELRKYLMQELDIQEVTSETFGRILTNKFLENQTDNWIIDLYCFLLTRKNLWQEYSRYRREGIYRTKSIVRLSDDSHTKPFDDDGNAIAFFPSKDMSNPFPTVKSIILENPNAVEFLRELGINEPDTSDMIMKNILPKYNDNKEISEFENITDVKLILNTINEISKKSDMDNLIENLNDTPFLYADNMLENVSTYKKPFEICISKDYIDNDDLEIYYEFLNNIWFLSPRYDGIIDVTSSNKMGVHTNIKVNRRIPNRSGYVTISNYSENYVRGLGGFDPACKIEGLNNALQNINHKKSLFIWNFIQQYKDSIYGIVESATRQSYKPSDKVAQYSEMGWLVRSYAWIPNKEGTFFKPKDIRLSEIHNDFQKDSEAKILAEKLHLKLEIKDEIFNLMPDDQKEQFERFFNLSEEVREKAIQIAEELSAGQYSGGTVEIETSTEDMNDIRNRFIDKITSKPVEVREKMYDNTNINMITPDDEETIRRDFSDKMTDLIKHNILEYQISLSKKSKIISRIPPKQFLLHEYDGHCQICNTRLDVGENRNPIVDTRRLIETRNRNAWTDEPFNILGLCPNCHALAKHGGINLENLLFLVSEVVEDLVAPEYLDERTGLYYHSPIILAGKEHRIFYSQRHMSYLSAFLYVKN